MLTIQRSKKCYSYLLLLVFLLLLPSLLSGAAKGKILGKITELDTGEPLIGVNIMLVGVLEGNVMKPLTLPLGAATNLDGEFVILNIPPGTYSVRVSMIGYGTKILEGIKVSINRTTTVNLELGVEELMGEEVVVVAKKAAIKKDKTSTIQTFSSEDLVNFNLESVGSAVQLSTGVVEGHFRGGRQGEVAYLIDGLQS